MTSQICTDRKWWEGELRRLHQRGPWDTPTLEAIISDSHAEKIAMVEGILADLDS